MVEYHREDNSEESKKQLVEKETIFNDDGSFIMTNNLNKSRSAAVGAYCHSK